MIAGQAPGRITDKKGVPFDDPSGNRLREWLGVSREQFYDPALFAIAPMGFCFPGQDKRGADLPPRPECARQWRRRVLKHLRSLELVLVIGQYAQAWHLGGLRRETLTDTVYNWRECYDTLQPRTVPLPHPSWRNNTWLSNNPWFEDDVLPVVRSEVERILQQ